MVGAPGSSRRCNECRIAKKKCGLEQPHCRRCRAKGLHCSGPGREQTFVNRRVINFNNQTQRGVLLDAVRANWTQSHNVKSMYDAAIQQNGCFLEAISRYQSNSLIGAGIHLRAAPFQITYHAVLDEFRADKTVGIFSADRIVLKTPREPRIYSIIAVAIRSLLNLASSSCSTLDSAIFGLLVLYLGRLKGDRGLVTVARESYAFVLRKAGLAIQNILFASGPSTSDTKKLTNITCLSMILQFFEFIDTVRLDHTNAIAHEKGIAAIMKGADPAILSSNEFKGLLQGIRSIAIFNALFSRRTTDFSNSEWLQASADTSTWCPRSDLFDLALEIPQILCRIDQMLSKDEGSDRQRTVAPERAINLHEDINKLEQKFEAWHQRLEGLYEGPLMWTANDKTFSGMHMIDTECIPTKTKENQLEFRNGPLAGILATYWSFRLELCIATMDLEPLMQTENAEDAATLRVKLDGNVGLARDIARLILEAMPYLSSCLEGNVVLQAPLKIVQRYYERYEKIQ